MNHAKPQLPHQKSNTESLALQWSFKIAAVSFVAWLGIFIAFKIKYLPLVGRVSIGSAIIVSVALIVFVSFFRNYIIGQHKLQQLLNIRGKIWLRSLSLSLAYSIIFTIFTILAIFLLSISFKGLSLDRYVGSIIIAVASALAIYVTINVSTNLDTMAIVNAFALFMVGGIFTSMATSINPQWWEINFSSLGATHTFSATVFNATLILSAILMLCMSSHLFQDLKLLISGNSRFAKTKANFVKTMFVFIAVCLAGVGLFPFYIDTFSAILHNLSAYSMVLGFAVLIIGIRYLIPALNKSFLTFSYIILGSIGVCFVLFYGLHYFNLTAFELNAFCISFTWLIVFLRNITALSTSVES